MANLYTNVYDTVMNKEKEFTFFFFMGGRGIGKTYSMLYNSYLYKNKIIYFRTNEAAIDTCVNEDSNPYKDINLNENLDIQVKPTKSGYRIVDMNTEERIGYAFAMTTFYKMRGAKFPEVDLSLYDEFLDDDGQVKPKRLASKFFNSYETINRNREFDGTPPMKMVFLANSFSTDNDILRTLNLVDVIREMQTWPKGKKRIYRDRERGIYLELLDNKKVRDMKSKTALYKLTKGTAFFDMALENSFTSDDYFNIKNVNFQELTPLCSVGDLTYYEHKSKDLVFVSKRKAQCDHFSKMNFNNFRKMYGYYLLKFHDAGLILYQSYEIKLRSNDYLKGVWAE